jgi:hypothetical protein
MTQFGISMNFLWIKQILAIIFILKIDFYSLFLDFLISWTGCTNTGKSRGLSARTRDTGWPRDGQRVHSLKLQGLFCESATTKGYGGSTAAGLEIKGPDQLRRFNETVHIQNRRSSDPRPRFYVDEGVYVI